MEQLVVFGLSSGLAWLTLNASMQAGLREGGGWNGVHHQIRSPTYNAGSHQNYDRTKNQSRHTQLPPNTESNQQDLLQQAHLHNVHFALAPTSHTDGQPRPAQHTRNIRQGAPEGWRVLPSYSMIPDASSTQ